MIIGAGIYTLPAGVAEKLGPRAWIAYVVCAVAVGLVLFCFAFSGSRVTTSGGPYVYVRMAFGEFPSFLAGVLLWVSAVLATAAVATIFADMMGKMLPLAATVPGRIIVLGALYLIAMIINVLGVGLGAGTVIGLAIAKVLPLVGLVLLAGILWVAGSLAPAGGPEPAGVAEKPLDLGAVGRAALVLVFAFGGAETALAPSGEIRRPSITVPLAIGIALGIVTVLYLSLQVVAQGVLGDALGQDPSVKAAPLAAVAERLVGPAGMAVLTVAALVSTAGYVLGDMLASPRMLYALSSDGYLPRFLGLLNLRFATPATAIFIHGTIALILAVSGTFEKLAILNNVAFLSVYMACCLGALVLARRDTARARGPQAGDTNAPPFKLPLGPFIPILASAIILLLLVQAEWQEFAAIGAAVIIAGVGYAFRRRTASSVSTK